MSYEAWAIIPNQMDDRLLTIDRWLLNSLNFKPLNKKVLSREPFGKNSLNYVSGKTANPRLILN